MLAAAPRLASAVVLFRRAAAGPEVFLVRRSEAVPFMGGFQAFPGGAVDKGDVDVALAGAPPDEPRAALVAAIRECFEETGVLLARGSVAAGVREDWRRRLTLRSKDPGKAAFADFVKATGIEPDAAGFRPIGHWITPPFSPIRFDSRYYLAELPAGEEATVIPGELASGGWTRPGDAVRAWERGESLVPPPVLHVLRAIADLADPSSWPAAATGTEEARGAEVRRIEMRAGVVLVPLRTPTLPPATHTNCYVVGGSAPIVVDPGADDRGEQAALSRVLESLAAEGRRPSRIAITHHHHDHVGGVAALRGALRVPVVAHADARETLAAAGIAVDETVSDGHAFDTGNGTRVIALYTPGHARGHLAFVHEPTQSLLSGDLILGMGTTVIDPPDGDMSDYMASLSRLAGMKLAALFPGHGPVLASTPAKIREYQAHRDERERQVLDALAAGADTPEAIVARVYTEVPVALHPFAARSVLAHLEWLERRGVVTRKGLPADPDRARTTASWSLVRG